MDIPRSRMTLEKGSPLKLICSPYKEEIPKVYQFRETQAKEGTETLRIVDAAEIVRALVSNIFKKQRCQPPIACGREEALQTGASQVPDA